MRTDTPPDDVPLAGETFRAEANSSCAGTGAPRFHRRQEVFGDGSALETAESAASRSSAARITAASAAI
jgi:hypothetical protein